MISEQGGRGEWGDFVCRDKATESLIYTILCLCGSGMRGCPPYSGRTPQSSSKVSLLHSLACLSPPREFRSNTGSGAGLWGESDWQPPPESQEQRQASKWGRSHSCSNKSYSQICANSTETTGIVCLSPFPPLNTKINAIFKCQKRNKFILQQLTW